LGRGGPGCFKKRLNCITRRAAAVARDLSNPSDFIGLTALFGLTGASRIALTQTFKFGWRARTRGFLKTLSRQTPFSLRPVERIGQERHGDHPANKAFRGDAALGIVEKALELAVTLESDLMRRTPAAPALTLFARMVGGCFGSQSSQWMISGRARRSTWTSSTPISRTAAAVSIAAASAVFDANADTG
jgi:hypothetical protein